ncbi:MAG: Host attachment protein [Hyphomicrobiales bacterium]|nr:MAG: Host attachment protein [Hyphomicrobiales bacterium]
MPGLTINQDAWVMVGDGEKAMFLRNKGDSDYPNLEVIRLLEQENPVTREQGTDKPGRLLDGTGPGRSSVEVTDWHTIEKHRFAKDIAEALYKAAHMNKFKELIVVAPPMTLGDLRKAFHKEVSSRVVGEVDKTLTGHDISKIEKILTTKD